MTAVGGRCAKGLLHREAPPPGFAPRFLRGEEIREVDRRHAGPDPAGAAKIGNPGFGADPGSGEHDGAARPRDRPGELGNFWVDGHAAILANAPRRAKPAVRC